MNFRLEINTTNLLISFNVLMFGLASLLGLTIGSYNNALDFFGADIYQYVMHGEVWRLITASFLHANIFHLFLNMYALSSLGLVFERALGGKKLFTLYIFAGLGGSLLSILASFFNVSLGIRDSGILLMSVGASGALFGILGFFLTTKDIMINKGQLYSILFLNLFIGLIFAGLIDNWAHIGGLITGMLFGLLNNKYQFRMNSRWPNLTFSLALLLCGLSYISLISYNLYVILYK